MSPRLENAELCIPDGLRTIRRSRYLLAREVIKNHLSAHLPTSHQAVEVHTFPALESIEFKEYLLHSSIQFAMIHDGAAKTNTRNLVTGDRMSQTLLRGMIWWFNSHNLNVALINRAEFRDSKVFTMVVESVAMETELQIALAEQLTSEIDDTRLALTDLHEEKNKEAMLTVEDLNFEELSSSLDEKETSESFYLAVYVICDMLKRRKSDLFLATAFYYTESS